MFRPSIEKLEAVGYGSTFVRPFTWMHFANIVYEAIMIVDTPACAVTKYMIDDTRRIRSDISYSEDEQHAWDHIAVDAFTIWARGFIHGRETLLSEPTLRRATIADSLLRATSLYDAAETITHERLRAAFSAWTDDDRGLVEREAIREMDRCAPGLLEARDTGALELRYWAPITAKEVARMLFERFTDYHDQRHFFPLSRGEIEILITELNRLNLVEENAVRAKNVALGLETPPDEEDEDESEYLAPFGDVT